ncbi:hypothetical protein OH807_23625 [Kitasatospora sp. NBC_01560]|uniref:amidohydrolase family protein n=1 Tax=Kitasatospora sp. NBC_01560 TaxID=2975965 RepID=UPI0038704C60
MLTLHRAALLLPDPADPTAPSLADGAVLVRDGRIAALGRYAEQAAGHPEARLRDWGEALLTPGLLNPAGHWLLEHAYHPDPREEIGDAPVPGGLSAADDATRCGASARRGLQRMLGFGVTAVAGPFERAAVRTAVTRSGLTALPGPSGAACESCASGVPGAVGAAGPLDPLAVRPLAAAVHGRLTVGGPADFAVFAPLPAAGAEAAAPAGHPAPRPGGSLATVLAGRLVHRRR